MDGDLPKAHVDIFHGWTHLIYAPNVWLHNSVGRTLHGYFEEVAGSNPVEAPIFSGCLLCNCLNWKIYCLDYSSLSSTTAVQIWIILCIVRTILPLAERSLLNNLTSLPICGVIAQLVEHRTGISRGSRVRIRLKPWFPPCIRLARGKFELTNQHSAGGKNFSVLSSS